MKRMIALLFIIVMIAFPAFAEDELFSFAGIPPETPYSQLESALEAATGLAFTDDGTQIISEREPPITFMQLPVSVVAAGKFSSGDAYIAVALKPFEVDGYANGTYAVFDDGLYSSVRLAAHKRFGWQKRMYAIFTDGNNQQIYRIERSAELEYVPQDIALWMFRNDYKSARVEIYRKNTCEIYSFTNMSDPAIYGNTAVAFVVPSFQYFSYNIESAIKQAEYKAVPAFPMFNGVVQYQSDF